MAVNRRPDIVVSGRLTTILCLESGWWQDFNLRQRFTTHRLFFSLVAALFEAVEQQDLDAVKAILDSNSVDVNGYVDFYIYLKRKEFSLFPVYVSCRFDLPAVAMDI